MKKVITILFAVALGLNLSAQTDYDLDWNPDADGDDLIGITDLLALLSLFAEADSDGDGIWDSVDDCIGVYDPCGVCNGTGEDVDEDGLCDDVDDCVGEYDECGVCNGPGPDIPIIDEILYATDSVFLDPLDEWYVFEYATDTLFTFVCPVAGCTDEMAGNYNPEAVVDDGSCSASQNALALQGIIDFTVPLGGNNGKAIHVVASADIADLSSFGIGVANNGGGTDGEEYTFPAASVSEGDDILVLRSEEAMSAYFAGCYAEFEHVFMGNSSIIQNGDDAIELFELETVIETFGDINVDGSGEEWEYTDSWAYKVDGVWTYGEVNCTDGTQTTYDSDCPYPLCSALPEG